MRFSRFVLLLLVILLALFMVSCSSNKQKAEDSTTKGADITNVQVPDNDNENLDSTEDTEESTPPDDTDTVPDDVDDTAVDEFADFTDNVDGVIIGEPSSELLKRIEIDCTTAELNKYHEYRYSDRAYINAYYGNFYGAVAVKITPDGIAGYMQAHWSEIVAGHEIHYSDGQYIEVWKNGEFYTLQKAYDNGILSEESIGIIAKTVPIRYYNSDREEYSYVEELGDLSVLNLPEIAPIDDESIANLEYSYHEIQMSIHGVDEYCYMDKYYGTEFSGGRKVFTFATNVPISFEKTIGGHTFKFIDSTEILVLWEGTYKMFYTLEEMYNFGYINDLQLAIIAELHNNGGYITLELD